MAEEINKDKIVEEWFKDKFEQGFKNKDYKKSKKTR